MKARQFEEVGVAWCLHCYSVGTSVFVDCRVDSSRDVYSQTIGTLEIVNLVPVVRREKLEDRIFGVVYYTLVSDYFENIRGEVFVDLRAALHHSILGSLRCDLFKLLALRWECCR